MVRSVRPSPTAGLVSIKSEELRRLVTFHQTKLLEQPTTPRALIVGSSRHDEIMVDTINTTSIRMVRIETLSGDDQGQAPGLTSTVVLVPLTVL
jgi:hypothetical protein